MPKQIGFWEAGVPKFETESIDLANGLVIHRGQMIGMNWHTYECLVPNVGWFGNYSTITNIHGREGNFGDYATKRLSKELDALPAYSNERIEAVESFHNTLYEEAYAHIYAAFPALRNLPHTKRMGRIDYSGENPA